MKRRRILWVALGILAGLLVLGTVACGVVGVLYRRGIVDWGPDRENFERFGGTGPQGDFHGPMFHGYAPMRMGRCRPRAFPGLGLGLLIIAALHFLGWRHLRRRHYHARLCGEPNHVHHRHVHMGKCGCAGLPPDPDSTDGAPPRKQDEDNSGASAE